jgi:uncharacterized membrane protein YvlD (DUF360 family)
VKPDEYLKLVVPLTFVALGVWWIVFPGSVIRFYTWFHRGRVAMPASTLGIRLAGAFWVVLVVSLLITALAKGCH